MSHSGKFVLRVSPKLHEQLARRASRDGLSLNALCLQLITSSMASSATGAPTWAHILEPAIRALYHWHGKYLLGVVAFGSQISGTATETSDLDLLVVLDAQTPIRRSLYREWDQDTPQIPDYQLDPHFTHLPTDNASAGTVWLEAAAFGEIVYDPRRQIQKTVDAIRTMIDRGHVRREWSHGHPHWKRSDHEKS